ncbi:hypothetical protein EII34_10105 [Arachnia propionica]|uniref:Uncharacterized protein n=1 Tax=Arachnia propionica TaxID=1750 RepID=A0A3P1T513_9ACTN|nr:transcription factor IIS helical bundle-like domain-containing protein [Arachnia propionica]RRD04408.1 hypothetical protein EII34_10105 [Arachnia propionica]
MNQLDAAARQLQEFAQELEPVGLARALGAMSPAELAEARAAWVENPIAIGGPLGELKRMILQAWLGNRTGWFAIQVNSWSMNEIVADDELRDLLVARLVERGPEWVQELLAEVTADPDHGAHAAPLLDPVLASLGLPEPTDKAYRLGRLRPWGSDESAALDAVRRNLAGLPERERAEAERLLITAHTSTRYPGWRDGPLGLLAIVLVAELGATAKQTAAAITSGMVQWSDPALIPTVLAAIEARGEQFVADFVAAAVAKRAPSGFVVLLDPLIRDHGLPLPQAPRYWEAWVRSDPLPRVGDRWQQRFLLALAQPNVLRTQLSKAELQERVRVGIAEVHQAEPIDDDALLLGLLGVVERGDKTSCQRIALHWLEALDLGPRIPAHRDRALAALASADAPVVTLVTNALLAGGQGDEGLSELAVVVLPRTQKGPREKVLKALSKLDSPTEELRGLVAATGHDPDATISALARELLAQWGEQADPPEPVTGLWRAPSRWEPEPVAEVEVPNEWPDNPTVEQREQLLAAVVALAHRAGAGAVRQRVLPDDPGASERAVQTRLKQLLTGRQNRKLPSPELLSRLLMQWLADVIARLGQLPCLLATPSHRGLLVAWEAFRERAARYREAGVALVASDVAVALGRLDRATLLEDLTEFTQPIAGTRVDLAEVLRHWAGAEEQPLELTFLTPPKEPIRWSSLKAPTRPRIRATGAEAPCHDLLRLESGWTGPFEPLTTRDAWSCQLLPHVASRPAVEGLRLLEGLAAPWPSDVLDVVAVARPLPPVLTYAVLVLIGDTGTRDRDEIAEALLRAWEEGRLSGDDLVEAWELPWRDHYPVSEGRTLAVLQILAEAGALALTWPLMVHVAERHAAAEKIPAAAAGWLETLLKHLPDVTAAGIPALLPNVVTLAGRKGGSKAIRTAREITALLS